MRSRSAPTSSGAASPTSPTAAFTLPGSRPLGCLLIHGFTGTPAEMRPLGDALAAQGFPVRGVRLAGHGTDVAELATTRWTDWVASAVDELAALRREVARVAVAGMSMGGLLSLHLAATRPAEVAALALYGTPIRLGDARVRWTPLLVRVPWITTRWGMIPKHDGPDISDPVARAASPSYRAIPLQGVAELVRLQAVVRRELGHVRQPTLLMHGRGDHSVPPDNLDLLRRGLGAKTIEHHVLEHSWHVVTLDRDRAELERRTVDFFARVERDEVG